MDRSTRYSLERYVAQLPDDGVRRYFDQAGPAVYELEPVPRTAILCQRCQYVGLILSIPTRATTWRCSGCDTPWILIPPREVLEHPLPAHPRLNREQRRRLA